MVTNDKDLISGIAHLFEYFTDHHQTDAILKIKEKTLDYSDLDEMFDVFNYNIGWNATKEGHPYYYFLNLRWAIGLFYLCHNFSNEYDNYCLEKIRNYYTFCRDFDNYNFRKLGYTKKQCVLLHEHYTKKIEKIEKLFGNIKN